METIIKECKKHGLYQHNLNKDGTARCSKCASEAVQKRRDKIKILSVEYKGGKCSICGYNKCIGALEFHHLNSDEKDFGIAEKGYTRSWEIVKEELDKCILVCSNCHRELHQDLRFEKIKWTLEDEQKSSQIKKYLCLDCGAELYDGKATRCVLCSKLFLRKVERPSKEELFILIKEKSFTELGKIYSVSDNCIKNWCKSYNIPSTKRELKELGLI